MTEFSAPALEAIRRARTVVIETSAGPSRRIHHTVIWIVVDLEGRVLVRAVRGARGRWFRELRANPVGAVDVGGTRIPVSAELADDADRIAACSAALAVKYRTSRGSLASMVRDEVLAATLELRPA